MRVLKRIALFVPLVALGAVLIGLPTVAFGRDDGQNFSARLIGLNETPAAINTDATATLHLTLNADSIEFVLSFQNLRSLPIQSHIHFGLPKTSGGVSVFFCGPATSPARQVCPQFMTGTVTGKLTKDDVIGPTGQGIAVGDFASLLRQIRGGNTYANIHTGMFAGGEIRGQIQRSDD